MADSNVPPKTFRIAALKDFLPLSADSISTRGQSLQGIIQSRSTTSLSALRNRSYLGNRRRSSFGTEELETSRSQDSQQEWENELPERQRGVLSSSVSHWGGGREDDERRRMSTIPASLITPQMRSQRLIGNSNPRYRWQQYWKTDEELKKMKKPIREYYERNNYLIQHYMYIDRLLDSSLPHNLIKEYNAPNGPSSSGAYGSLQRMVPETITEETTPYESPRPGSGANTPDTNEPTHRVKRTPRDLYRVKDCESTPLLSNGKGSGDEEQQIMPPDLELEEDAGSQSRVVTIAIYMNLAANTALLIMKIIVVALSSSVSVLASLVDVRY